MIPWLTAALYVAVMAGSAADPQAKKQPEVLQGNTRVTDYDTLNLDAKAKTYVFSFTGASVHLTSNEPAQHVDLHAARLTFWAAPDPDNKKQRLDKAIASGKVSVIVKQRDDKGGIIRTVQAWANEMTYYADRRLIELSGAVRVVCDEPAVTQTGDKGTIQFVGEAYKVTFSGGTTEFHPNP